MATLKFLMASAFLICLNLPHQLLCQTPMSLSDLNTVSLLKLSPMSPLIPLTTAVYEYALLLTCRSRRLPEGPPYLFISSFLPSWLLKTKLNHGLFVYLFAF